MDALEVHVIGSGTPTPHPDRYGTSLAVVVGPELLLFDCGPATTYKMVRFGLRPTDVRHLFFSHHHSDHNADYPCFLLTHWEQSIAGSTLHVHGPPPTTGMTEALIGPGGVFRPDIDARIGDPGSRHIFAERGGTLPRPGPNVVAEDVAAGAVVEGPSWRVAAGHARHAQPFLECLAYRLETADAVIVFTGDTGPSAEIAELAAGADLLLCMCWDAQARLDASGGSRLGCVCGTDDAARIAAEADVGRLVLLHSVPAFDDPATQAAALARAGRIFRGPILVAHEGLALRRRADGSWRSR